MKLLLDTCTLIWLAWHEECLSERARDLLIDPPDGTAHYLSAMSVLELAIKHGQGKLAVSPAQVRRVREDNGIKQLDLSEEHAEIVASLPDIHQDPFDRSLVAQAIVEGMVILTPDEHIGRYPVRSEW